MVLTIRSPSNMLARLISLLSIVVVHETDHAWFARRAGARVRAICLGLTCGVCICDQPSRRRDAHLIAWGGVLAQLTVTLPLIVLLNFTTIGRGPFLGDVVGYMGYFNLLVAAVNLLPIRGLDGWLIWRIDRATN